MACSESDMLKSATSWLPVRNAWGRSPRTIGVLADLCSRLTDALSTFAIGALIGIGRAVCVFDEHPVPALVLAAAALGAVLTSAVRQAVTGRP